MRPLLACTLLLAAACAARGPDPAIRQATDGEALYTARCATCHAADDAAGPALTESLIRSYGTARALFDYIRMAMPSDTPGALPDSTYWQITAHIVRSRGIPLARPLNADNAHEVRLDGSD